MLDGKVAESSFMRCVDSGRSLDGIGARQLIDRHDAGRRLVVACRDAVGLVAQLDASNVAQVKNRAVGIGAKNDVAELFRLTRRPCVRTV